MLTIPYNTGGYVKAPLNKWESTIADPTTLPVEIAIITTPDVVPQNTDYVAAAWVTEDGTVKAQAKWLTAVPAAAPAQTYSMWLRLTVAGDLIPVYSGLLRTV